MYLFQSEKTSAEITNDKVREDELSEKSNEEAVLVVTKVTLSFFFYENTELRSRPEWFVT